MANTIDIWPSVNPLSRNTVADGAAIQRATIQPLVVRTEELRRKLEEIGDGNIPAISNKLDREIADRQQADTNLSSDIVNETRKRNLADNDIIDRIGEIYEEIDDTINFVPGEGIEFVDEGNNTIAITAETSAPAVEIVSPNDTIDITEETDPTTNVKTFSIDTKSQGDAKFGIFNKKTNNYIAYNNGGWTFSKKTGSLEISQDETTITGLKQNKIYHVTCEGSYKVISQCDYILTAYIQDNDGGKHYFDVDLTNNINREIPVTITFDYLAEVPGSNNDYVFVFTKWGSDETSNTTYNASFEIKSLSLHEIASVTANEGESPEPPQPVTVPEIKAYGIMGNSTIVSPTEDYVYCKFVGSDMTTNTVTRNSDKTIITLKSNAIYNVTALINLTTRNIIADGYERLQFLVPYKANGNLQYFTTVDLSNNDKNTFCITWQITDCTELYIKVKEVAQANAATNVFVNIHSIQFIETIV